MSAPTVIRVEGVSKRFVIRKEKSVKERIVNFGRSNRHKDDFWALRDVNLEIASGTTIGLIGPNGSGKSTLLKVIGGILQPNSGTVQLRGRLAALLELGAGFHPDLTGRENVYLNASILGLSRSQTDANFDAIVDFSGIEQFIDTQVKFYSSGMYVRLAFAVAVHVDPDILLVDEVLAVGDEPFQRKCMERIRGFQHEGRTIVLVTHSLDQVADLCDRAVVLEHGNVIADGAPRDAIRALRHEFEQVRLEEVGRAHDTAARAGVTTDDQVTIESVDVLDGSGNRTTGIVPGQGLVVAVTVATPGMIDDAVVSVGIDTPLGQAVYSTSTRMIGKRLPALYGRSKVSFRLQDLRLGDGTYNVRAAVSTESGRELTQVLEAAQFNVRTDGRSTGFIWTASELTTETL